MNYIDYEEKLYQLEKEYFILSELRKIFKSINYAYDHNSDKMDTIFRSELLNFSSQLEIKLGNEPGIREIRIYVVFLLPLIFKSEKLEITIRHDDSFLAFRYKINYKRELIFFPFQERMLEKKIPEHLINKANSKVIEKISESFPNYIIKDIDKLHPSIKTGLAFQ